MARHALDDTLGRVRVTNLAGDDRIKSNNLLTAQPHVGLRRVRLLGLERMPSQKAVEFRLPAGEVLDGVGAVYLFDAERGRHCSILGSNTDGSRNKRSSRG